jgi:dTDP-4-amino-4,6-dideoxygalactose transaminase
VSHAQGGKYQGRKLGTFGDVAAMSLMGGKSFAVGEGGMLVTDDRKIFERAVMFGHYERTYTDQGFVTDPQLQRFAGLPMGGYKHRMNQTASAMGRVQLKYYDKRCKEIRKAMNYFWDQLEGLPGLHAHRVDEKTGSTMGGWYCPMSLYHPEELGGLPATKFVSAVAAEGASVGQMRRNLFPLHLHPLLTEADVYHEGKPTIIANAHGRDTRQKRGAFPVSEAMCDRIVLIPWFKHFRPAAIKRQVQAYRKVAENYQDLL